MIGICIFTEFEPMASGTYAKNFVRKWFKDFPKSDLFQNLNPVYQKNSKWTIEFFAEMMADYMDDPPLSWNGKDTAYLVIHLIPSKSIFEKSIYKGFCPILRAFFEYLGRNFIEEKWSKELVKSLTGKDHELLKNAESVIDHEESNISDDESICDLESDERFLNMILALLPLKSQDNIDSTDSVKNITKNSKSSRNS